MKNNNNNIYETKDYSIFKQLKGNRSVRPALVKRIKMDIKEHDLYDPIVVNEKMEVLDGQHQLQARKELNVSVKYLMRKGDIQNVMKFNSIQQRWNNREFLDSYCARGFKEYEMLDYFVREYKLGISFSMGLLIGISRHVQTNTRKDFMEGKFKIKDFARADEIAQRINTIGDYVDFNRDDKFMRAVVKCMSYPEFNWKFFLNKLESKSTKLRKCGSRNDYIVAIERFYNHGTSDRKRLQFDLVERGSGHVRT